MQSVYLKIKWLFIQYVKKKKNADYFHVGLVDPTNFLPVLWLKIKGN